MRNSLSFVGTSVLVLFLLGCHATINAYLIKTKFSEVNPKLELTLYCEQRCQSGQTCHKELDVANKDGKSYNECTSNESRCLFASKFDSDECKAPCYITKLPRCSTTVFKSDKFCHLNDTCSKPQPPYEHIFLSLLIEHKRPSSTIITGQTQNSTVRQGDEPSLKEESGIVWLYVSVMVVALLLVLTVTIVFYVGSRFKSREIFLKDGRMSEVPDIQASSTAPTDVGNKQAKTVPQTKQLPVRGAF